MEELQSDICRRHNALKNELHKLSANFETKLQPPQNSNIKFLH